MKDSQKQLEELKEEYKDFVYKVSHDLNSPTRHIREFTRMLFEEVDCSSDEAQKLKKFIDMSVDELEKTLSCLLKFSRANTEELNFRELNSKEAIEIILPRLQKYTTVVELEGEFPIFPIDLKSFQNIFYHVLDNALKFQGDLQTAVVVRAEQNEDFYTFKVIDHGEGIPSHKITEAFKLFKRLSTIKGDGMGLTLAQKLIRRCGGEVTLESTVGEGTTVTLSFPK